MPTNPRHTLKLVALVLCALALVATGCGGGSSYKSKVEEAAKQFKKTSVDAGAKLRNAKTKQAFAAGVQEFQGAVRTFNGKLKSLTPPSGAKSAQDRLISVLNTFSGDVGAVRDALNKGDVTQIQTLQGKVVSDVGAVQSAAKELQSKAG
jgi:hypothetical protein